MKTSLDLKEIAASGGNLIIDAKSYSSLSIKEIAKAGYQTGATLYVKNASHLTSLSCKEIAKANPGHVSFDFRE